jgi:hypothetical protein
MGVKHVEAFGDSLLVVQQIVSTFQCLDRSLNAYLDKCLEIIAPFNDFTVHHISRDENTVANNLAQQASGFQSNRGKFGFLKKPDVSVFQTGQSSFQLVHSATICTGEPSSAEPDSSVFESGGSRVSKTSDEISETTMTGPDDWRTSLVRYLENHGHITDRKV